MNLYKVKKVFESTEKQESAYSSWVGDINFKDFQYPEDDDDAWNVYNNFVYPYLKKEFDWVDTGKDDKNNIYVTFRKTRGGQSYTTDISKHILFTMSPKYDGPKYAKEIAKEVNNVLGTLYGEAVMPNGFHGKNIWRDIKSGKFKENVFKQEKFSFLPFISKSLGFPEAIKDGIRRYNLEGTRGLDWTFFHVMDQKDRDAVDKWLVTIKHPLAYEPGTQEMRFKTVVVDIVKEIGKDKLNKDIGVETNVKVSLRTEGIWDEKPIELIFSSKEKANAFKNKIQASDARIKDKISISKTKGWKTYSLWVTPWALPDTSIIKGMYEPEQTYYKDIKSEDTMKKDYIEEMIDLLVSEASKKNEAEGDLMALVGKTTDDDLTDDDAKKIGVAVAKMSGDELQSYLGMIKALGGYYSGKGDAARLDELRDIMMKAYNDAKGGEGKIKDIDDLIFEKLVQGTLEIKVDPMQRDDAVIAIKKLVTADISVEPDGRTIVLWVDPKSDSAVEIIRMLDSEGYSFDVIENVIVDEIEDLISEQEGDKDVEYTMVCPNGCVEILSPVGKAIPTEGSICVKCGAKLVRKNSDE